MFILIGGVIVGPRRQSQKHRETKIKLEIECSLVINCGLRAFLDGVV